MQSTPRISESPGPRIAPKPGAIKSYCEQQSITRNELARRMGVDITTAYRVDTGETEPSPKFIARLMETTGQGFDDLFVVVDGSAA